MKKPTSNTRNEGYKKALLSWEVIASTLALIGLGVVVVGLFVSPNSKTLNVTLAFATVMSGAAAGVALSYRYRKKDDKE